MKASRETLEQTIAAIPEKKMVYICELQEVGVYNPSYIKDCCVRIAKNYPDILVDGNSDDNFRVDLHELVMHVPDGLFTYFRVEFLSAIERYVRHDLFSETQPPKQRTLADEFYSVIKKRFDARSALVESEFMRKLTLDPESVEDKRYFREGAYQLRVPAKINDSPGYLYKAVFSARDLQKMFPDLHTRFNGTLASFVSDEKAKRKIADVQDHFKYGPDGGQRFFLSSVKI